MRAGQVLGAEADDAEMARTDEATAGNARSQETRR
jgi:hypothetical protein